MKSQPKPRPVRITSPRLVIFQQGESHYKIDASDCLVRHGVIRPGTAIVSCGKSGDVLWIGPDDQDA